MNPTPQDMSILSLVLGASAVVQGIMLLLLIVSFMSWYYIFLKWLTVRDTEKLVQKALEPAKARVEPARDPQIGYLERQLAEKIGNQVQLQPGKRDSGKLVISYENLSDLDRILGYFGVSES